MNYTTFEQTFHRRAAALSLTESVQERIDNGADPYTGWLPNDAEINEIRDQWLPAHAFICQYKENETPCDLEADKCERRCSAIYWREHSNDVAQMMVSIAGLLHQPPHLWKTAGLLHDLDYVKYPHHDKRISSARSHPMGVSNFLYQMGAPPVLILAILSHAPHLCLRPESALGWALMACDEHSTMTGFMEDPAYDSAIDARLTDCLIPKVKFLRGFHRSDMQIRANLSLLELTSILKEKSPALQLNSAREKPFDWDANTKETGVSNGSNQ